MTVKKHGIGTESTFPGTVRHKLCGAVIIGDDCSFGIFTDQCDKWSLNRFSWYMPASRKIVTGSLISTEMEAMALVNESK